MMKTIYVTLVAMLLLIVQGFANAAMAQQTVTGTVTSATDGEPLIGATVKVVGGSGGSVTDLDGHYKIAATQGQSLEVSYVGFLTKTVKVTSNTIDIVLEENKRVLNEVVVVGYGVMKRSDVTGSTVSVTGDDMKKTVAISVDQALQGRAAGVSVTQNSGAPGGGISVNIRGTNSLNGNEPLYVIDGIAVSGQTDGNSSALASLNPSDILSMEVLKDASATAIYGSRASNGVVLIKTKQGEAGKTKLSYDGYVGVQRLPKTLEVLNLREYAQFYNERATLLGWSSTREDFADPSILGEGTNWQKEIFRSAFMHNHQLGITGGNEQTRFALSVGYTNQDGIAIGTSFDRLTARINLETQVSKWLTVGINSALSRSRRYNSIENDYDSDGAGVIMQALKQMPEVPVRNPDGSFGEPVVVNNNYYPNPVANAYQRENYNRLLDAQVNAFASLDIVKGLNVRIEYGGNFSYNNKYKYVPLYRFESGKSEPSSGERRAMNNTYASFKAYATYLRSLGKHTINVMAGHEAQENRYESLFGSRTGFESNTVHELGAGDASTAKNGSTVSEFAIESYFGRFNYNFDDRYLLTATLRADGSSAFGPDNRWGYFPSVALAWRANNEAFLRDVAWLNALKLRLSWGLVGNQNAGNYAYGATMTAVPTVWGTGFYPSRVPNNKLKWEKTNSWNAGVDLALFHNRIELILDAYYKRTDNMLVIAPLPSYASSIIGAPWVNVGAMQNKGFEITLNTVNVSKKDLTWKSGLTFSLNRNKVTDLYTATSGLQGNIDNVTYTYTQVGSPVGQFYGYKVKGMFSNEDDFYLKDKNGDYLLDANGNRKFVALPTGMSVKEGEVWYGDYIWEDLNGDGVIDEKDRTNIGNPLPKFTFGLNNSVTWKNFDLNVFISGSVGNKVYNYLDQETANPINWSGVMRKVQHYARVEKIDPNGERTIGNMHVTNPSTAEVQRISNSAANDNNRVSDRFVEDGSYLRLKNVSLGYTLPRSLVSKAGLSSVRVYANIQNLLTITGYSGYDPEVGAYHQDVLLNGVDYARYPSQRIFTFGMNINF